MPKEFDIQIDKSLLRLDKDVRAALVSSLAIIGDVTQNKIRQTKKFRDITGTLRRLILRDKVNAKDLSVKVKSTVSNPPYGLFLNDGTKYIKARKFMEEGLEKASKSFKSIILKSMKNI